ncbi:MAG TPA: VWA domain-containing protein [Candidatus Acidoferrales bacterium]|nr:VWA domain-containing protein [Candidatus Acidoferrales bacterium]
MTFARQFAAVLLAFALSGAAQQTQPPPAKRPAPAPSPQDDPQYRIRTRAELVVVPITVKDAKGEMVLGIRQSEFRVLEDDVEQEISVFSTDPFPLSAVVLLDNGLAPKPAQQLEISAPAISAGFAEGDEVAVTLFEAFPQPLVEFTRDNDKLYDHLKRVQVSTTYPGMGSGPMTAGPKINQISPEPKVPSRPETSRVSRGIKHIDDAIYSAGLLLRDRGRDRRKIIFIVSDGANSPNNEKSFDDTLKLLLSADISVYAVGVDLALINRGVNPLSRYARLTGGDIFYAATRADMENTFSRVTEQARNQYTLAYAPRGTDRNKEFHSVEVRVRRAALSVRARDGYYTAVQP